MTVLSASACIADEARTTSGDVATSSSEVNPLTIGDKCPAVSLVSSEGTTVSLTDLISSAPAVLVFYRGGWCPYCNTHLGKLATIEDELTSAGYQILAITPDAPEFLNQTAEKYHTQYQLLSDSSAQASRAFGLAFRVDDSTFQRYQSFKIPVDLEVRAGGQTHHILPVPAAYVVDQSGTIKYAYWNSDYKKRVDEQELLKAALKARQTQH